MLNDSDIEKLTQKQVTIEGELGETTFTFEKMMALKAWKLALSIREEAGKVLEQDLEAIFQMDRNRMVASLFKIVLKMPTPYVILVQETLWEHTFFTNKNSNNHPQLIYKADDAAFDGHDASVIGEVLVRALAVNFTSSLRRLTALLQADQPPPTSPS